MNILIVIASMGAGGAERVTAGFSRFWSGRGDRVRIISFASGGSFYPVPEAVELVQLGLDRPSRSALAGLAANLGRLRALRGQIREFQPDVVIGMMTSSAVLTILAGAGLVPTIAAERVHAPSLPVGRFWSAARAIAYGFASAATAQTEAGAAWLRDHTWARKVAVIPNSIEWPLPRSSGGSAPGDVLRPGFKTLLAVGRLEPQKGFDLLLQSFAAIAGRVPGVQLAILGEGPERTRLEAMVAALGLSDRVDLPGRVGDIAPWYAAADLFVMSSRFEGFPNALLEALSSGLPAVSFDCPDGPSDLVRPGVDGWLAPPEDVAGLADALLDALAEPQRLAAMGLRAQDARQRYSPEAVMRRWDELFARLGAR